MEERIVEVILKDPHRESRPSLENSISASDSVTIKVISKALESRGVVEDESTGHDSESRRPVIPGFALSFLCQFTTLAIVSKITGLDRLGVVLGFKVSNIHQLGILVKAIIHRLSLISDDDSVPIDLRDHSNRLCRDLVTLIIRIGCSHFAKMHPSVSGLLPRSWNVPPIEIPDDVLHFLGLPLKPFQM